MSEQQKYWFAARTRDKQEFSIRQTLGKLKTEEDLDIDYYMPTQTIVRQLKHRRKRVEVPVVKNLVFVYATKEIACDISNKYGVQIFYMRDLHTHSMLTIPAKQMEDFMFVLDLAPDSVSFDNDYMLTGDKVKVVKGDFNGVEGEIATDSNKTYVVIRIQELLTASVRVPKNYLMIMR